MTGLIYNKNQCSLRKGTIHFYNINRRYLIAVRRATLPIRSPGIAVLTPISIAIVSWPKLGTIGR